MRDHLLDGRTYRGLTDADCTNHKKRLEQEIKSWMKTYNKTLSKMERTFLKQGLEHNKKAFAGFYLTLKAHKLKPGQNVTHLKSRPIVACPGSLLHPLGIWIDRKLQTLAKQQVSYFHNSYELRQELCSTKYPPSAKLFTANAILNVYKHSHKHRYHAYCQTHLQVSRGASVCVCVCVCVFSVCVCVCV